MSADAERERLFLGLMLPEELGARVLAQAKSSLTGYRLPRAEGLHLTLSFLGDCDAATRAALDTACRVTLTGRPAPWLALGGTGAFPSLERARVLWAGVEESRHAGRLASLQRDVLMAVARAGLDVARERERPFTPHVTLARPRRGPAPVPDAFRQLRLERVAWQASDVALVRSERTEAANAYRPVERYPLGP